MEDMEDKIDEISCSICCEKFSLPMTTKCSHTFCKKCLDDFRNINITHSFECPLCRKVLKYNPNSKINDNENGNEVWENKILNSFLSSLDSINNLFSINIEPLLSIKLIFYYCKNCNMFISNYTLKSQNNNNAMEQHSINSLFKYSYSFFEKIKNKSNCCSFQNIEKLFMCLYYFYNSEINKFECSIKKKLTINSGEYNFYGEILEINSKNKFFINIIQNMLRDNTREKNNGKLFKGILSKIGAECKIHGIFYIIQNKDKFIIRNAFGLYNYNNDLFFGFIKINKNNEIHFNCGLLYYNFIYFFGIFSYNEKKANELKEGEIIYNNGTETEIVKSINNIHQEESILILNENTIEKIVITPLKSLNKNKLFYDTFLNSCKIFLLKFNFSIIFNNYKLNSYLLVNESKGEKSEKLECLYSFNITLKDSKDILIINKLKDYKIKDITKNEKEFKDYINRLVTISLNDCEINYKLEKLDNILDNNFLISGKYYSINTNEGKVIYKENNDNLRYLDKEYKNNKLKQSQVKDLFNIFDDDNDNNGFKEKIKSLSSYSVNRYARNDACCLVN